MATPQLSPGVLVREVDLTVGRAENVLDNIGAIVGPFKSGPVNESVDISTEQELIDIFGTPASTDAQYEYWMSASSYLAYGGVLKVVRTDSSSLSNANAGVGDTSIPVKIKNFDDFNNNFSEASNFYFAAKEPGSWANTLKVCIIDDYADQIIGIATTNPIDLGFNVGFGVTCDISGSIVPGTGSTEVFNGYLKGIVTEIRLGSLESNNSQVMVKIVSRVSAAGTEYPIDYAKNNQFASFKAGNRVDVINNSGIVTSPRDSVGAVGLVTFTAVDGEQNQIYTGIAGTSTSGSDAVFRIVRNGTDGGVESATVTSPGVGYTVGAEITLAGSDLGGFDLSDGAISTFTTGSSPALLAQANQTYTSVSGVSTLGTGALFNVFRDGVGGISTVTIVNPGGVYGVGTTVSIAGTSLGGSTPANDLELTVSTIRDDKVILQVTDSTARVVIDSISDWYESQTLNLTNSIIYWSSIAPKPVSNKYVTDRNGRGDAIHVVVVDDTGDVTGIQGNILEKHISLSKSRDAVSSVNSPQKIWYKDYLANNSKYIYAASDPSEANDGFQGTSPKAIAFDGPNSFSQLQLFSGLWGQNSQNVTFTQVGSVTYELFGGNNYTSNNGYLTTLGDLITAYNIFSNKDEIAVDYLINGPGLGALQDSQAKANHLISIAESRKDCVAVVSPHKAGVIDIINSNTQTDNIIEFFSALTSSSYAVFDSGYKYTYDRFNNIFRYIPCNPDVAGLMCRTNIVAYPWFSPAGQQRGNILNAIKLAFNPNKAQRDRLYPERVNCIINQPGGGIILFGDKTALSYQSAFDRINVRRLFLTIEQALEKAAQSQLFEFNDQLTRANFINIVEPYLRDVQAKRGVYDYLVICDETNNTPDVIDNNEFRADIYLKPAKSINYVTLTFIATRTGVSFEEVAGRT
jgi:hypothetical protein